MYNKYNINYAFMIIIVTKALSKDHQDKGKHYENIVIEILVREMHEYKAYPGFNQYSRIIELMKFKFYKQNVDVISIIISII